MLAVGWLCICGGVVMLVFLRWLGCVFVVVRWCFYGGVMIFLVRIVQMKRVDDESHLRGRRNVW